MNESSVRELTESAEEYRDRVNRLRTALRADGRNAALIFNPDHIFWLTG
ncbi:MAG: aminopeptidase P family N-terminal domain-containing protein [Pirellulales bacterium]